MMGQSSVVATAIAGATTNKRMSSSPPRHQSILCSRTSEWRMALRLLQGVAESRKAMSSQEANLGGTRKTLQPGLLKACWAAPNNLRGRLPSPAFLL